MAGVGVGLWLGLGGTEVGLGWGVWVRGETTRGRTGRGETMRDEKGRAGKIRHGGEWDLVVPATEPTAGLAMHFRDVEGVNVQWCKPGMGGRYEWGFDRRRERRDGGGGTRREETTGERGKGAERAARGKGAGSGRRAAGLGAKPANMPGVRGAERRRCERLQAP